MNMIKFIPKEKMNEKTRKVAELLLNEQFIKFEGVITAISSIEFYLKNVYGEHVVIPNSMKDRLLEEINKIDIKV